MKRYPLNYNPVIEYYNLIQSGEVIVSRKVERVYNELVDRINNPDYEYYYNAKHANHAIEFIENFCKHSKGNVAGKPFILEIWQKALVAATFGFLHKETELRMVRELILIIPRKHGKSAISSALCLYLLMADGEGGAEVYSIATKKDQAKIIWDESKRMIKKSPALNKRVKTLHSELKFDKTESIFKPLSSDSNSLDGLNVHASAIDELHAIKDKNLYDVIVDGMTAREQPLSIITSTAGTVREGIFDIKYDECESIINGYDDGNYRDDRVLPIIYELDSEKEIHNKEMWQKANPALGTIKNLEELERKYNKALNDTRNMSNLLCKDFNIRQNGESAWLSFEQIDNKAEFDMKALKPKYCIGGVDLSRTTDLTSACIGFMLPDSDTVYYRHMYWLPEDTLEIRLEEDKVPYDVWIEKGYMRLCEGNTISYSDVVKWFKEVQDETGCYLYLVGYDSYSANYFVEDMQDTFGKSTMVAVPQYAKVLSIPMEELGAKLKVKKINYGNNPITKWCLMNTTIKEDINGNIQPQKGTNKKKRIDGLAAMLDSFVVLANNRNDYYGMIGKYN